MAFPIPDHLPRRQQLPKAAPHDVSSAILTKLDSATNATLTAALATSWVVELDTTIAGTKQAIHDRIHRDLPLFEQQLETSKSVQTRLRTLEGNVQGLEKTLSDAETGLIPTLVRSLSAHSALAQQATNASIRHEALAYLLRCRKAFTGVLSLVQLGKLPEAVVACNEFEDQHLRVAPEYLNSTNALTDLKRKFQAARSRTEEQLNEAYSRSVVVSPESITVLKSVVVRQSETTISLSEILSSLTPSALANLLTTLRRDISNHYIDHLLQHPATLSISSQNGGEHLQISPSAAADPILRLDNAAATLSFLYTNFITLLPQTDARTFARSLVKPLTTSVLTQLLVPCLPASFEGLPAFLELAKRAVDFEDESAVRLLGADTHDSPIRTWVDGLGGHYERRRRVLILERARKVVLGAEGNATFMVEIDPFEREKKAVLPDVVPVQGQEEEDSNGDVPADEDGWGFNEGGNENGVADDADGWGFDEEDAPTDAPVGETEEAPAAEDSWGFSDDGEGAGEEETVAGAKEAPSKMNGHHNSETEEDGDAWGWKDDEESSSDTAWDDDPWNDPPSTASKSAPSIPAAKAAAVASPAPKMATRLEKLANKGKKGQLNGNSPLASPLATPTLSTSTPPPPPPPPAAEEMLSPATRRPPQLPSPLVAKVTKETYLVTTRMREILAIVEDVVKEGEQFAASRIILTSTSDPGALILQSAPSAVDLYRALFPVQFATRLKSVADAPMQLSNDCLWLGAEVAKVEKAFVGSEKVKERLGECAERLRVWGDSWFEDTVDQHRTSIEETISKGAEGFTFLADQDRFDDCEAAIARVIADIKRLAQRWKGVLNKSKYYTAIGMVTDAALAKLLEDVLALPDITEVESHRLHELFRMLGGLEALFVEDANPQPFVVAYVPSWLKFSYLSELMDASMRDIVELFESGALVDFEVDELVRLVRALFADNVLRTNTINKLMGNQNHGMRA